MSARAVLYTLLAVVASCAAVLSFSALHDLALLCGFIQWTAPLLPLVVDAGAAAGTLAWLTRDGRARAFGRVLALTLLFGSVGGNAIGHALSAFAQHPSWWLVVAVSGVAPAVLGAVVHLAVVAGRPASERETVGDPGLESNARTRETLDLVPESNARGLPLEIPPGDAAPAERETAGDPAGEDVVTSLIESGAGRRRVAKELGLTEHEARVLLDSRRPREVTG